MTKKSAPDTLHLEWTCPFCHWKGEVAIETHFGNDQGRDLRPGDCLFDCHRRVAPRHLYFLECFACPGCSTEDERSYFLAEIHCIGNRWIGTQTFPAPELEPAHLRV
jgi:hypothetical protein